MLQCHYYCKLTTYELILKKTQEAASFPSFEDGNYFISTCNILQVFNAERIQQLSNNISFTVPGPCEPEDLIDGIIFAANYLGCTQVLSDKNPSKSVRMSQAHEAVGHIKVTIFIGIFYHTMALFCVFCSLLCGHVLITT